VGVAPFAASAPLETNTVASAIAAAKREFMQKIERGIALIAFLEDSYERLRRAGELTLGL